MPTKFKVRPYFVRSHIVSVELFHNADEGVWYVWIERQAVDREADRRDGPFGYGTHYRCYQTRSFSQWVTWHNRFRKLVGSKWRVTESLTSSRFRRPGTTPLSLQEIPKKVTL